MAFWSATRRWAERAVAAGVLSVEHIKSGDPAACTPLAGSVASSSTSIAEEDADKAADLLEALLTTLIETDAMAEIPEPLYAKLERWVEVRFAP